MDKASHSEEPTSNALVPSRPEQIRYLQMPAGPTVVNFPPNFTDILLENRFAQTATVDQQRELMLYTRRLNEWMGHEVGERHDDLRRLRALFQQIGRDIRDLQDEEEEETESTPSTSGDGSRTVIQLGVQPQHVSGMPANLSYPTLQHPPVIPYHQQPPLVGPQPRPVMVMIPKTYAPKPIRAASKQAHPRPLLPPPRQPGTRVAPPFIPPNFSAPGLQPLRPATSPPGPIPPRQGMGSNVVAIPESSSSGPSYGFSRNQSGMAHRRSGDQPFFRRSMGSDVNFVPLSTSSARSSSPARRMGQLAPRGSVASLRGRGDLRRTPSGISQRSQVVATPPSLSPTGYPHPGPATHLQPVIRPPSSLSPAAVVTASGPGQQRGPGYPTSRPPLGPTPDMEFSPVPLRPVSPVFTPRMAQGQHMAPVIIGREDPVSGHRRGRAPIRTAQPIAMRSSPTRLTKRRPQPMTAIPAPVIPSRPIGHVPPPPQPEVVLMPESMRNRQNRRQLRPIDTSVVVPQPAVTAMTYPETGSHGRTTVRYSATPLIIPRSSPASSSGDFRGPMPVAEHPVVIPASQPVSRRPSPPQSEVVLMPARTESIRRQQSRHQLHPIDTSAVTAMTYPEIVGHVRTTSRRPPTPFIVPESISDDNSPGTSVERRRVIRRPPTPFIVPESISDDSSSRTSVERPAVIRRSRSRPSIIQGPQPTPSRLTKRRPQPTTSVPEPVVLPPRPIGRRPSPPEPEAILMPARTEPIRRRENRRQIRPVDRFTAVTEMTYPETNSHVRSSTQRPPTPFIVPEDSSMSDDSSSRSSMEAERPAVIRRSRSRSSSRYLPQPTPSRLTKRRPQPTTSVPEPVVLPSRPIDRRPSPPEPEVVVMPARTESIRRRESRRQVRPVDTSTVIPPSAVTALTYPETMGHVRTLSQRVPTPFIVPQSTSSDSSTEGPAVIRRSPSRSSSRNGSQPPPSRLTKRRRPEHTATDPVLPSQPISRVPSPPEPEIVVMPARTNSMRSRQSLRHVRPMDGSTDMSTAGVTAMTYPETISHVRTAAQRPSTPYIFGQGSPVSSDGSPRSSFRTTERPAVLRKSASRSTIRRESQPATAIPIPVVPASQPVGNIITASGPQIVVMPARSESPRSRRDSSDSSPVVLSDEEPGQTSSVAQGSNEVGSGAVGVGTRSLPGAVVVPLDSEAEEAMGMRSPTPTLTRRASFSGRDWVTYGSRSGSAESYNSRSAWDRGYHQAHRGEDRGSRPVIPSFRGRSSPHVPVTPTRRWSRSPPRIYRSASPDMVGQRSRHRRRSTTSSSPASMYASSLLRLPARHRRDVSGTITSRGTLGSRSYGGHSNTMGSGGMTVQGERRDWGAGAGMALGPNSRPKRAQGSWLTWMNNL